MSGTITAEIPVSFSKTGKRTIPSVSFRFYDIRKGKVVKIKTKPVIVNVTGKKDIDRNSGGVVLVNQDIRRKGEDIRFIAKGKLEERSNGFYRTSLFMWLVILPLLLLIIAILKYYLIDPKLSGNRKPEKRIFRETINNLKNCKDFGEICSILDRYIAIKTDTGNSSVSTGIIDSIFEKHGVGRQDSKQFIEIRSNSESLRYSGGDYKKEEMGRVVEEILEIVGRIDRKLK